jgi:NAD(P)-dependent dehydrogenase (short-subunit alcohol dehydrogenase family)
MAPPPNALVVGASRGIGLGLVRDLARRGWSVTGTARDMNTAPQLAALAAGSNGQVRTAIVDIADAASAGALRDGLKTEAFDVILINAGVGGPQDKTTRTVSDEEFTRLFVTNALAPVRMAELLVRSATPQTGVIGFTTSLLGSVEGASAGGFDLYRGSKAALNSMTRSFAARHKDKGLAVLSLHPGWVKTDMGGPDAPVGVEDSARGLVDVVERARADRRDGYFDYTGATLAW